MKLYVDPGLRGCGCALFEGQTLQHAAYVKNSEKMGRGYKAYADMAFAVFSWMAQFYLRSRLEVIRIELPRIYPGSAQQKGDLNDLLDLAGVGGAIAAYGNYGAIIEHIFPSEWKGQVPKQIMTQRIMSKLTIAEAACVESAGAKDHNTYDAIGIGLHHVGRLGLTRLSETL